MATKHNWAEEIKPLLKKYKNKKHPLEYSNMYQLLVMVVLSAQTTDNLVNDIAPALFKEFPNMAALANAKPETLDPLIRKVRGSLKKGAWLIRIAQLLKTDKNIPLTMAELTKLPGIGRKSANVIMREAGVKAEGVIVDLHVLRVAPRLGIAKGEEAKDIEKQILEKVDPKDWGQAGIAISFLGRDTCRPTNPKHEDCVLAKVCDYFMDAR